MDLTPIDSEVWTPALSDHFTGSVWLAPMSVSADPTGLNVLAVLFSPGSRTDWHSHPGGQVLHVTSGRGIIASRDGARVKLVAGDTVTSPPNDLHWHGANDDSPMMHLSITVGGATVWATGKVTHQQYLG